MGDWAGSETPHVCWDRRCFRLPLTSLLLGSKTGDIWRHLTPMAGRKERALLRRRVRNGRRRNSGGRKQGGWRRQGGRQGQGGLLEWVGGWDRAGEPHLPHSLISLSPLTSHLPLLSPLPLPLPVITVTARLPRHADGNERTIVTAARARRVSDLSRTTFSRDIILRRHAAGVPSA